MPSSPPTPREIEQWSPSRLSDFLACEEAKATFVDHLRVDGDGTNILLLGETGTGKTSLVDAYVRTRNCPHVTDLAGPCGKCSDCREFDFSHRDEGIFAHLRLKVLSGKKITHFFHVNCFDLTEAAVRKLRYDVAENVGDRKIVYLDEVQHLAGTATAGILLKAIRELDAVWVATGITVEGLSPMFVRRFAARCTTSRPGHLELARFVRDRCRDWSIAWDSLETVSLLAERSQGIAAECISVLARAAGKEGRLLSCDLVERHPFITGVRK